MTVAGEWETETELPVVAVDQLWQKTAHILSDQLEYRINLKWLFLWLSERENSQAP